ncbi:GNAT family N-acetyltransferase [Virgibacillus dakarensis]|nr:GNAT family N-acetyltransferase [Virgibacillus dakarensis]
MNYKVSESVPRIGIKIPGVTIKHWYIDTKEEKSKYLKAESEIWPDDPTGVEKLREYKNNPFWKAITAFYNDKMIIGSILVWKVKNENIGTIEDVFVKPYWRRHGLAKHLITEGIRHLRNCNLEYAQLLVETKNQSALKLYKSLGFEVKKEERRYWVDL